MKDKEKAEIILKELDFHIQVDWNFKDYYLNAIERGLKKVREAEEHAKQDTNRN